MSRAGFARASLLAGCSIFFMAASSAANSGNPDTNGADVVGVAHDLQGGEIRYREYHYYSADKLNHRVIYVDTSDTQFIEKELDYRSGFTAPSYQQTWLIDNRLLKVERDGERVTLKPSLGENEPLGSKQLMSKSPLVIDAGFDHFVREHWQSLLAGEYRDFYFPLVKRSRLAKLRILQAPCSYQAADVCFRLEVSNWLLRLLLDPIELGYDRDSQRLLRYRGLSNIEDSQGDGMVVDIHYHYPKLEPPPCEGDCSNTVVRF